MVLFTLAGSTLAGLFVTGDEFSLPRVVAAYFIGFGAPVWIGVRRRGVGLRDLIGRRVPPVRVLAPLAPLLLGYWVLLYAAIALVTQILPVPESFMEAMHRLFENTWVGLLIGVLAAPVLEEVLFRGLILAGLLERFRPWTAIATSALLFGVAHGNPWQFVAGLSLGLLLGWLFYRTRSLGLCILTHAIHNFAFGILGNEVSQAMDPEAAAARTASVPPIWLLLAALILFVLGSRAARRSLREAAVAVAPTTPEQTQPPLSS